MPTDEVRRATTPLILGPILSALSIVVGAGACKLEQGQYEDPCVVAARRHGEPYASTNAPRPALREVAAADGDVPPPRPIDEIRQAFASTIEASAANNAWLCGEWTLVEITPRIVALAVELRAAAARLTPEQHVQTLHDAHRRLLRTGMRVFYARVQGDQWERGSIFDRERCEGVMGAPYIVLEDQRGRHGRLVEATASLREHRYVGTRYGVLMLEDVVLPDDATYTVAFADVGYEFCGGKNYSRPGGAITRFTFDATEGRVLLALSDSLPPTQGAPPPNQDTNGDGFTIGDAISLFGTILDVVGVVAGLAAL